MGISKDSSAPLVAVIGATGLQGGSVIKALADSDKPYRIRGATRDVSKPASKKLSDQGAEMVAANIAVENKGQFVEFFKGATYGFIVTDFWQTMSLAGERDQGKMMVDAAKEAGVKRLIWSGLSDCAKHSNGKYTKVDHFQGKAEVTAYGHSKSSPDFEFINVECGLYFSNVDGQMKPMKTDKGDIIWPVPAPGTCVAPWIDTATDYGLFVRKALEEAKPPKDIYAYGEEVALTDIVKQLSEVIGKPVAFQELTREQYIQAVVGSGMPEAIGNELWEMMMYFNDFAYFGTKDIAFSRQGLARPTKTWKEYAQTIDWNKVLG